MVQIIARERTQAEVKRVCSKCGSDRTRMHPGSKRVGGSHGVPYPHWYHDDRGKPLCWRCYDKYVYGPKRRLQAILFKGRRIRVDNKPPKTGVCNFCRAVKGEINAQTGKLCKKIDTHHEVYDETNALAHTIECCTSCHTRISRKKTILE